MRGFLWNSLALSSLLLTTSCASLQLGSILEHREGLAPHASVPGVPFIEQPENYCGPASLAMVSSWAGNPVSLNVLASWMISPEREGTLPFDLLTAARRNGLLVTPVPNLRSLFQEIGAGHPVIVMQNLGLSWLPRWHYAVVTSYDLDTRTLVLHSGKEANMRMELELFERTWTRADYWGIVAVPPDRIPASATLLKGVEAASSLERVGRNAEAATAYTTILRKWPQSVEAYFGLSNASAAMGDFRRSARALNRAVCLAPHSAPIWFNLAIVYSRLGKRKLASRAASSALALAEPSEHAQFASELKGLVPPDVFRRLSEQPTVR